MVSDRTLRLNVELLPETAGTETVTVIGTPPTIDVGSSTVGRTINTDFVRNLAVSRPGGSAAPTAPSTRWPPRRPGRQRRLRRGDQRHATSPENSYLIDGLSVNDTAYGVNWAAR